MPSHAKNIIDVQYPLRPDKAIKIMLQNMLDPFIMYLTPSEQISCNVGEMVGNHSRGQVGKK